MWICDKERCKGGEILVHILENKLKILSSFFVIFMYKYTCKYAVCLIYTNSFNHKMAYILKYRVVQITFWFHLKITFVSFIYVHVIHVHVLCWNNQVIDTAYLYAFHLSRFIVKNATESSIKNPTVLGRKTCAKIALFAGCVLLSFGYVK